MLRTKALVTLVTLAASACALYQPPNVAATSEHVLVQQFKCAEGAPVLQEGAWRPRMVTGTLTQVDGAILTSNHVISSCNDKPEAVVFPEIDLAILEPTKLTSCRAPRIGEAVQFSGYPATNLNGKTRRSPIYLEKHQGVVTRLEDEMLVLTSLGTVKTVQDQWRVSASYLRGGYSGGPVTSLETGEFLGIINTGSIPNQTGSFTSARTICEKMEEVL
mgnify:CR=1 FL=1